MPTQPTTSASVPLVESVADNPSSGIGAISWILIPAFGAAALLLLVAAMPPAWAVRAHVPAALLNRREDIAMFGGVILLQTGLLALLAAM